MLPHILSRRIMLSACICTAIYFFLAVTPFTSHKEPCRAGVSVPTLQVRAGVPNLQAMDWYPTWPVRNRATQQAVSLNVMHFNHPEDITPTPARGKIVFHGTSPWCPKGWGLLQ